MLMIDTQLPAAVACLERAREAVEGLLPETGATVVTFSAGVAAASAGVSWETTVRAADALLYEAKDGGRNRVMHIQVPATSLGKPG